MFDPQCGCNYYFNSQTKETTWEKPPALKLEAQVSHPHSQPQDGSEHAWKRLLDPASKTYYFYSCLTGETRWDEPPDFATAMFTPQVAMATRNQGEDEGVDAVVASQRPTDNFWLLLKVFTYEYIDLLFKLIELN